MMTASWDERKHYEEMWVGMRGKRTIGQQRGTVLSDGECNATSAADPEGETCFGWTVHNKPLLTEDYLVATGHTVIIHLSFGVVNRIVWDSSCNLCSESGEISCHWDQTDVSVRELHGTAVAPAPPRRSARAVHSLTFPALVCHSLPTTAFAATSSLAVRRWQAVPRLLCQPEARHVPAHL